MAIGLRAGLKPRVVSGVEQTEVPYGAESALMGEGELVKGLRRGMLSDAIARLSAEGSQYAAAGKDTQATNRFAQAQDFQEEAAALAPEIASYRDIRGLGDAASYAAGRFGEGLPGVAPLLAGAALGRVGGGLIGPRLGLSQQTAQLVGSGIGASAPGYTPAKGAAVQRLMADPTIMAAPDAAKRIEQASSNEALVNSVLLGIPPAAITGQTAAVLARPVRGLRPTLAQIGAETAKGAALGGGFGYAAESIGQLTHSALNPTRSRAEDTPARIEAALSGATALGPVSAGMAGIGAAGNALRFVQSPARAPSEPVPAGTRGKKPKRFSPPSPNEELASRIASRNNLRSEELFDWLGGNDEVRPVPDDVRDGGTDAITKWLQSEDQKRQEAVQEFLTTYASDTRNPVVARSHAAELLAKGDRAAAAKFIHTRGRELSLLRDKSDGALDFLAGFVKGEKKSLQKEPDATGRMLIEDLTRSLPEGAKEAAPLVAESIRRIASPGSRMPKEVQAVFMAKFMNWFGTDAPEVLSRAVRIVNRSLKDADRITDESVEGMLTLLSGERENAKAKAHVVASSLSNEFMLQWKQATKSNFSLADASELVRRLDLTLAYRAQGMNVRETNRREAMLSKLFGERYSDVLEQFNRLNEFKNKDKFGRKIEIEETPGDIESTEGFYDEEGNPIDKNRMERGFLRAEDVRWGFAAKPKEGSKFGTPFTKEHAEARIEALKTRFPDRRIDLVTALDYAKEEGVDLRQLAAKIRPDELVSPKRAEELLKEHFVHRMSKGDAIDTIDINEGELQRAEMKPKRSVKRTNFSSKTDIPGGRRYTTAEGENRIEVPYRSLNEGAIYFDRGEGKPPVITNASALIYLMRGKHQQGAGVTLGKFGEPDRLQLLSTAISSVIKATGAKRVYGFDATGREVPFARFGVERRLTDSPSREESRLAMVEGKQVEKGLGLKIAEKPEGGRSHGVDLPGDLKIGKDYTVRDHQLRLKKQIDENTARDTSYGSLKVAVEEQRALQEKLRAVEDAVSDLNAEKVGELLGLDGLDSDHPEGILDAIQAAARNEKHPYRKILEKKLPRLEKLHDQAMRELQVSRVEEEGTDMDLKALAAEKQAAKSIAKDKEARLGKARDQSALDSGRDEKGHLVGSGQQRRRVTARKEQELQKIAKEPVQSSGTEADVEASRRDLEVRTRITPRAVTPPAREQHARPSLERIISGGQTGADIGGLTAGKKLKLKTGGTAPHNWMTEKGPQREVLESFGLKAGEVDPKTYRLRTIKNVEDADGTVWFGKTDSPGAALTLGTASQMKKPVIVNPTPESLRKWLVDNNVKTLNVAGNRESKNPGIARKTLETIEAAMAKGKKPLSEVRTRMEEMFVYGNAEKKARILDRIQKSDPNTPGVMGKLVALASSRNAELASAAIARLITASSRMSETQLEMLDAIPQIKDIIGNRDFSLAPEFDISGESERHQTLKQAQAAQAETAKRTREAINSMTEEGTTKKFVAALGLDKARFTASAGVPKEISAIAEGWVKLLGLDKTNIHLIMEDDLVVADPTHSTRVNQVGLALWKHMHGENVRAYHASLADRSLILLKPGEAPHQLVFRLAHELGHAYDRWILQDPANAGIRMALVTRFVEWLNTAYPDKATEYMLSMRQPETLAHMEQKLSRKYPDKGAMPHWYNADTQKFMLAHLTGDQRLMQKMWEFRFTEFWAEQTVKWLTTDKRPVGVVEKFFHDYASKLKRIFEDAAKFVKRVVGDAGTEKKVMSRVVNPDKMVKQYFDAYLSGEGMGAWMQDMRTRYSALPESGKKYVQLYSLLDRMPPGSGEPDISLRRSQMSGVDPKRPLTDEEARAIPKYVRKVLGPKVKTLFEKELGGSAGTWDPTNHVVRILAGAAAGHWNVAYHEAMHGFVQKLRKAGHPNIVALLEKVAGSEVMQNRLNRLLEQYPDAQKQVSADAEERVAYMYQFWAAGDLAVVPEAKTLFQKIGAFLRKTFNYLRDDERALDILESFHDGKMETRKEMAQSIASMEAKGKAWTDFNKRLTPFKNAAARLILPADTLLGDTDNPDLQQVMRAMYTEPVAGGENTGYINRKAYEMNRWLNRVDGILADVDKATAEGAMRHLIEETTPKTMKEKRLVADLYKLFEDFHAFSIKAGVKVGKRGKGKYFPWAWDFEAISAKGGEFEADLLARHRNELQKIADAITEKNKRTLDKPLTAEDIAEGIKQRLTRTSGVTSIFATPKDKAVAEGASTLQESEDSLGYTPFMQAINKRSLGWVAPDLRSKWQEKDLVRTLSRYFMQGVKRTEYVRAFGHGTHWLEERLFRAAEFERKRGKTDAEVKEIIHRARTSIMAMEGTLGHDKITPGIRKLTGLGMVYQNLRLLPLMMFASIVDPMGIAVRGGGLNHAFKAYERAIKEIAASFKGTKNEDSATRFAESVGAVDSRLFQDALGEMYSGVYMTGFHKRANDTFFKMIGMEQWNRAMRIQAASAAQDFIKENAQYPGEHSARWLKDLGISAKDVQVDSQGNLKVIADPDAPTAEVARAERLRFAVNRWVDGAIVRPNPAHRPPWGSDPRFAVFFHMKQFAYSMQKTILKHAANEWKHGNTSAAMALLPYIPMMIAADVTKAALTNFGDTPGHMKGWSLADYVSNGIQRAGLLGVPQFGLDALAFGPASLAGPTAEQLINLGTGNNTFGRTGIDDALVMSTLTAKALGETFKKQKSE